MVRWLRKEYAAKERLKRKQANVPADTPRCTGCGKFIVQTGRCYDCVCPGQRTMTPAMWRLKHTGGWYIPIEMQVGWTIWNAWRNLNADWGMAESD